MADQGLQLEYLLNHLILPPKLPDAPESEELIKSAEEHLTARVVSRFKIFISQLSDTSQTKCNWIHITRMLHTLHTLTCQPDLPTGLLQNFNEMNTHDVLVVPVRAQNAVLMFRKQGKSMKCEVFENSPRHQDVLACQGALRRSFPSHAVEVPLKTFYNKHFLQAFVSKLASLDSEEVDSMIATIAYPQGRGIKDTADPALATDMLFAMLVAVGQKAPVQQIYKRTKDDVICNASSQPWRRSCLWLTLRVSLQMTFRDSSEHGDILYKNFVLFVLADIVDQAKSYEQLSDNCHAGIMKLGCRTKKLGSNLLDFVAVRVNAVCEDTRRLQQSRWSQICLNDGNRPHKMAVRIFKQDTELTLVNYKNHLADSSDTDATMRDASTKFSPDCPRWLTYDDDLPSLAQLSPLEAERCYALSEFENWVLSRLEGWVESRIDDKKAKNCELLAKLAETYHAESKLMEQEPGINRSTIILSVALLWLGIDKLATHMTPIMKEYSTDLPSTLFSCLLLPKASQMERLHSLELYLLSRAEKADEESSLFSEPGVEHCFSNAYFNTSKARYQRLKRDIDDRAKARRQTHQTRHDELSKLFCLKKEHAKTLICDLVEHGESKNHDASDCQKCKLNGEADAISMDVHEWPLPDKQRLCTAVLVELEYPTHIMAWRNVTSLIRHHIAAQNGDEGMSTGSLLPTQAGLIEFHKSKSSRLTLATKPSSAKTCTHLHFPLEFEQCCSENKKAFFLYDRITQSWISSQTSRPSLLHHCTPLLPEGAYKTLQYAIESTTHSQNQVIAEQGNCPTTLNILDYKRFGFLRADGSRIQWFNILLALKAHDIDFNTPEVFILLRQAAIQAGPAAGSVLREAHIVLESPESCNELLVELESLLNAIEGNWNKDKQMHLIIIMVHRIMALTNSEEIRARTITMLSRIRTITVNWSAAIVALQASADQVSDLNPLISAIIKSALLCKTTFDVDGAFSGSIPYSADDICAWICSCVRIRENIPADVADLSSDIQSMLAQDQRISQSLLPSLVEHIKTSAFAGIDQAYTSLTQKRLPEQVAWTNFSSPSERWLERSSGPDDPESQTIHIDLLQGNLLIDGKNIRYLPTSFTSQVLYIKLFGSRPLRVRASDVSGMMYTTVITIHGYEVHLNLNGKRLVIQLERNDYTWQAVCGEDLRGDVPLSLIMNHVHLLNLSTKQIEFRPQQCWWDSNSTSWRLQLDQSGPSAMFYGEKCLLDINSQAYSSVADVFGCLDDPEHIIVSCTGRHELLEVELCRYDLHFSLLPSGIFLCKELSKHVDTNQAIDTLIGLQNRLVLCGDNALSGSHGRTVLVPLGQVERTRTAAGHIQISITADGEKADYILYQIDTITQRLKCNNEPRNLLYLAYLHGSTSHFLADPLLHCSGTEEALTILRRRSLSLFEPPDKPTMRLLSAIARLSPKRQYFPPKNNVMQTIDWDPKLSQFAQHEEYAGRVETIGASGNRYTPFNSSGRAAITISQRQNTYLLERARVHHSGFRRSALGGDIPINAIDKSYTSRELGRSAERAAKSFEMAVLAARPEKGLKVSRQLAEDFKRYKHMENFGVPFDHVHNLGKLLHIEHRTSWGPLQTLFLSWGEDHLFEALFLLGTIAYGSKMTDLTALKTLLAFMHYTELRSIAVPTEIPHFNLFDGHIFSVDQLKKKVKKCVNSNVVVKPKPRKRTASHMQNPIDHKEEVALQKSAVIDYYASQWPCEKAEPPDSSIARLLSLTDVNQEMTDLFETWNANEKYTLYCEQVQPILNRIHSDPRNIGYSYIGLVSDATPITTPERLFDLSLRALMQQTQAPAIAEPPVFTQMRSKTLVPCDPDLTDIISKLNTQENSTNQRQRYQELQAKSQRALTKISGPITPATMPCGIDEVLIYYKVTHEHLGSVVKAVSKALIPSNSACQIAHNAGLWPSSNVRMLLQLLSHHTCHALDLRWKSSLVQLGKAIVSLQRARRLLLTFECGDIASFCSELENAGSTNWDPVQLVQWLLLQIENDFLIRPIQAEIAMEMIDPAQSSNFLIQLNMGEGKSSVIVPMIACAVADTRTLSRVIVLKHLYHMMTDTLVQRFGGIMDRKVYLLPVRRDLEMDVKLASQMQQMQEECRATSGVLIMQPDHVQSYKILCKERLLTGNVETSEKLFKTQDWLNQNAKDIIDESDEVLDPRNQLVYSFGSQKMIDGQPGRWLVIEAVLDILARAAVDMQESDPDGIEVVTNGYATFPHFKIFSNEVKAAMIAALLECVLDSQVPGLSLINASADIKAFVRLFLEIKEVDRGTCDAVKAFFRYKESAFQVLLQVRGLIAHGVLLHIFQTRRWSVNYGLDLDRRLSAVPFLAKGVPAPLADFGHLEVAIVLTCLAYYYSGMSSVQVLQNLRQLERADDPSREYRSWIRDYPEDYRLPQTWSALNLDDSTQFREVIFPNVRCNKEAMNFYLNNVVFPKEAMEYDGKISSSGWDLSEADRRHPTVGFSGTNDNQFLLPISITQRSIHGLEHTSASVLNDILKPENRRYECFQPDKRSQITCTNLLEKLMQLDSRVNTIIDVGAQILDCGNKDVAILWLEKKPDASAAVYFDRKDAPQVVTRDGKIEKLSQSPYNSAMENCLVFMDESHTRGTDLKLSDNARAAVTLGPRLSKDRLVQACKRMRNLARGQSLMFIAPWEVHAELLNARPEALTLTSRDVIAWCCEYSCNSLQQAQPLRILSGLNYARRRSAERSLLQKYQLEKGFPRDIDLECAQVQDLIELEDQSLLSLYGPVSLTGQETSNIMIWSLENCTQSLVTNLLREWNEESLSQHNATIDEQHEREVALEVERETQIQRPPMAHSLKPKADSRLETYIRSGSYADMAHFTHVREHIKINTSIKRLGNTIDPWRKLHATSDFMGTVEVPPEGLLDNFLRPVSFALTESADDEATAALIISPFEANEFLRLIHGPESRVHLHLYEPRVTKAMKPVDAGYELPHQSMERWRYMNPRLVREFHMFAGQLWFNRFEDYVEARDKDLGTRFHANRDETLAFLHSWIAIRRMGQPFSQTHMGFLASGRTLSREDFD